MKVRFFEESLVVKLGVALGTIVILALTATLSATVFTESSTGKAAAINLAGSLRMQAYWITVQVLRSSETGSAPTELPQAIAEFETRLANLQRSAGLPAGAENPTRRAYHRVASEWFAVFKPAVEQALAAGAPGREAFVARMSAYVRELDRLVSLVEQDLEGRIATQKIIQGAAFLAVIIVMLGSLYFMHQQVIVPLGDLLQCARRVRCGDFGVRARHTGEDELGQLGQAFNYMVADLSRSYATLEARVKEKTEQLARSNVSLEVLYNTTRTLAENPLSQAALEAVMAEIERVIGLKAAAVCAREEGDRRGFPIRLATKGVDPERARDWCTMERCYECVREGEMGVRAVQSGGERMLAVPLAEAGKLHGLLLMQLRPGAEVEEWKKKLLESVGHHIGAALAAAKRTDERRRIALMEERSIIARELHDSLAQSLSYLKIQVARLSALLSEGAGCGPTAEVLAELKLGINNAYRQLRELLTTFRLRIDGRGLSAALHETIREFSERAGLEIRLHDGLLGHELDSNEQIHVLQVVREALANVEHHARARRVDVRLAIEQGRVRVTVDDDGVGIVEAEPPPHHYGLAIMRDRAATLGGTLRAFRRPEGGTRVELDFAPRGPFRSGVTALSAAT